MAVTRIEDRSSTALHRETNRYTASDKPTTHDGVFNDYPEELCPLPPVSIWAFDSHGIS